MTLCRNFSGSKLRLSELTDMKFTEKELEYKVLTQKILDGKKDIKKLSKRDIEIILNILSWKSTEEKELIKELCSELLDRDYKIL